MSRRDFIEKISEEVKNHSKFFLPSVTLAQACLESADGKSELAKNANNLFGIKADKTWSGDVYVKDAIEEIDGKMVNVGKTEWRKYDSIKDSIADHDAIMTRTNWHSNYYKDAINAKNYQEQAKALQGTYATDSQYANKLITIIEQNKLYEYDKKVIDEQEAGASSSDNTKEENVMSKKAKWGLDIGHGSNTYPTNGKGVRVNGVGYAEHTFNSRIALKTKKLLEDSGVEVVFVQQPNSPDIPLATRTYRYKRMGLDGLNSFHANAGVSSAHGRCAFAWGGYQEGIDLAKDIISEIKAKGYSTHGSGLHISKRGSWTNLHMVRVPSEWSNRIPNTLVEYGFMTNSKDFQLIFGKDKEQYSSDMAEATAKGICKFLGIAYKGGKVGSVADVDYGDYTANKVYVVRRGDSLWKIAQANGLSVKELKDMNGLDGDIIHPDQKLVVKKKEDKKDEVIYSGPETYTVKSGDTLGEISNEFGVDMDKLVSLNNISNPDLINVGATLKLTDGAVIENPKPTSSKPKFIEGEKVRIDSSAKKYSTGENIPKTIKDRTHTIMDVAKDKVLLREIYSWVDKEDIEGASSNYKPRPTPKPQPSTVNKGQKVTVPANKLYATGNSKYPVKSRSMAVIVETVHDGWKNQVRLKNSKGVLIGFARISDLITGSTATKSTAIKEGDKVTANKLYVSGYAGSPARNTPITGYVEKVNKSWKNPYRLTRTKGGKDYIGYTRSIDIKR